MTGIRVSTTSMRNSSSRVVVRIPTEAELAEREGRSYESAEQLIQRIRITKLETGSSGKTALTKRKRRVG